MWAAELRDPAARAWKRARYPLRGQRRNSSTFSLIHLASCGPRENVEKDLEEAVDMLENRGLDTHKKAQGR